MVMLVVISGCDLFETRQPELPQQGQSGFTPPTSASIVVQNLTNAIAGMNVDNYLSCLSDSSFGGRTFSFVPSSDVIQQVFLNWDKNSEQTYFNNLIIQSPSSASPALTLSSQNFNSLSSDSVLFSANYTLLWPNKSYLQQVQGSLQFYLGHDKNQNWSIYRWIDSKIGDNLTWSELKAQANP
jgi:hypothetical protein